MNEVVALSLKRDLQAVIEAYEGFLYGEIETGSKAPVAASEALVSRDLMRTISVSETSRKRALRASGAQSRVMSPKDQGSIGSRENSLTEEAGRIGSALSPAVSDPKDNNTDRIFKDLEDCIPCKGIWDWPDIDWERLKKLLTFDLMARFQWLTNIDDFFKGNPMLDQLCNLLRSFRNLCPQDLMVLIAIITAFITKTIDSIKFNLGSAFKDILGSLLRPYISGLEDFLNFYIQYLVDQVECVLNAIQTSAESIRDLNISNSLGPDSIHFRKELTGEKTDNFMQNTVDLTKGTREFLRQGTKDMVHDLTDDIPTYLKAMVQDVLDWTQLQVSLLEDAVIDILGGEWLFTNQNISWYDQLRNAATLRNIIQVIVSLGNLDELCSEDNIRKVVNDINTTVEGDRVSILEDGRANRVPISSGGQVAPRQTNTSSLSSSNQTNVRTTPFSLNDCLSKVNPSEEDLIRRYVEELS